MTTSPSTHSFQDDQDFRRISWSWAKAYDTKDWALLRSICAPTVQWLYNSLNAQFVDKQMTIDEYVEEMSAMTGLGDPRLSTQHLLGAVVFEEVVFNGQCYIVGDWQAQASHRRILANGEVRVWDGFSYVRHYYARDVNHKWQLAGVQPHTVLISDGHPGLVLGKFD
ncbi:NTF2-like protein [Aureobasidium namibiae CBS 147.97]|uniref:NTF2-like protein n=1 Tax=Aureobasidium namibiae CBS 147.97 TaxID=1043004 RepID=A0A074XDK5_9PEZI